MSESAVIIEFIEKDTTGPYAPLANQTVSPFDCRGKKWPSVEHFVQALKFEGTAHEEAIRSTPDPWVAHKLGRTRKFPLRADWEQVKEAVMAEGLRAKFSQSPSLRELLLASSPNPIVYHSNNDKYWGKTASGEGSNRLGELLVALRTQLLASK